MGSRSPILAALIVSTVGATIITILAELATPPVESGELPAPATGALAASPTEDDTPGTPTVGELASGEAEELSAESLFDPAATARIVVLWVLTPVVSVIGSYLLFAFVV